MSSIYLLEPHTSGKVILHTSYGDISIELWPKEAPKACRNFVQHCMDGYYNETIFHRIVAGFIVQGGDPEGTGLGGESAFDGGKPFADEFHSRLRFVRRGLVAMANSGEPNDNKSQFFITLDSTLELQNKHTIFGKIAGDTIFNVLKIGDLEVDSNERPLYPPKITHCTIVVNPFDDVAPRVSRRELEAARLKELETQKKPEKPKKQKKNVALLSFADDAPDMTMDTDSTQVEATPKKKMLSSHDLLEDDPTLSREVDSSLVSDDRESSKDRKRKAQAPSEEIPESEQKKLERAAGAQEDKDDHEESLNQFDQRMRDQVREKQKRAKLSAQDSSSSLAAKTEPLNTSTTQSSDVDVPSPTVALSAGDKVRQEIQKLESDIRKMHNRDGEDKAESKQKGKGPKVSLLQLEREQYKTRAELTGGKGKKSKSSRGGAGADKERDLLDKLSAFEAKVFSMASEPEPKPAPKKNDAPPCEIHGIPSCESCRDVTSKRSKWMSADDGEGAEEGEAKEEDDDDDDIGWLQHKLVFEKDLLGKEVSLSAKREDPNEYLVIDPLDKSAATTAALAIEKQQMIDKMRKQQQQRSGAAPDRDRRPNQQDRPYDRPSRDSSSRGGESGGRPSSYQQRSHGDGKDGGRDYKNGSGGGSGWGGRDNRNHRDSRDRRDNRDSRDNRSNSDSRDRRW